MPNGKETAAQAFYLAQLQACRGKCQCNVCKLLRKAADAQTEALLNPKKGKTPSPTDLAKIAAGGAPGFAPGEEEE